MSTNITKLFRSQLGEVHCPVCGKIVESASPEVAVAVVPCEHLLFTYYTNDYRFNYVSPSCKGLQEITDRALAAREDYEIDAFSYAVRRLRSRSVLCFSLPVVAGIHHFYAFAFERVVLDEE